MVSESLNLNMELKINSENGGTIPVGFLSSSIDKNGFNLNTSINIINKQLIADNLESIKQQYIEFNTKVIENAIACGFNFIEK